LILVFIICTLLYCFYKSKKRTAHDGMSQLESQETFVVPPSGMRQRDFDSIHQKLPAEISFLSSTKWRGILVYRSTSPDEISLNFGDELHVVHLYADSYVLGYNISTGWVGNFPLSTIEPNDLPRSIHKQYKRILPRRNRGMVCYKRLVAGAQ
jgi:hypothetical protein